MALSSELSFSERQQIQQWVAAHGTPQQVALRCRIVLAAADGQSDVATAQQLSVNRKTVILWRQRFSEQRLDGLWEIAPGRGRKPSYDTDKIAAIVDATLQTKPEGMTHWSCRTMAESEEVRHQQYWAGPPTEASPGEDVQVVARPEVPRENDGCDRVVLESAPAGHCVLCEAEKSNPGAGSHSPRLADQEGPLWDHDPRL